ncbi:MAG: peptidoglycan DD-metalloendopeptidase family protein [Pseudomonadota bacterium]
MKSMFGLHPVLKSAGKFTGISLLALLAACGSGSKSKPQVEIRGTDPATGQAVPQPQPQQQQTPATGPSTPDASGIVTYNDYQTAVAQNGDTVADVAARVGMSASELGSYNGLQPSHVLRQGDELVLPQRPGGYGTGTAAATSPQATSGQIAAPPTPTSSIEAQPLDGVGVNTDGSLSGPEIADAQTGDAAFPAATPAASPAPPSQPSDWSPDLAAAAIERSQTGIQQDGTLGAPPSSDQPVPPEPTGRRELQSPDLSQYQTPGEKPDPVQDAGPETPQDLPEEVVATTDPAPAAQPSTGAGNLKLRRPVQGPVAIGFNKGAGAQRNDGVDFAAPAGSPVVAAADGEVALVSQSLGGLGTIVLVRHPGEILTVYGRVDDVSVKKGDIIASGQQIGVVSNAAAPAEPRMHFEVRRGAESLDPMQFL